jgi:hypothetical protein
VPIGAQSWRRTIVWFALGVIGLSAAVGLPRVFQLLSHLPPFYRMANTRLIWLIGLAVAVLAAFGTDRLLAERPSRPTLGVAAGAVALGLLAVAALAPSFDDIKLLWNHFRTGTDWAQVVSFTSIAWFVLLAALTLGRCWRGGTSARAWPRPSCSPPWCSTWGTSRATTTR